MQEREIHIVTGAYGYSGRYIARRLLDRGVVVRTLTDSAARPDPFDGRVRAFPFHFEEPARLVDSLRGAAVLYNTYWVRFDHRRFDHATAVQNTLTLFACARQAGVGRVVHVSITNPSEDSPLPYFRGKARLERALAESGLSRAILRPTVLFGKEDILINNIAWLLRRFPVFGVFGRGDYRLQPIYVDDLAKLAVEQGCARKNIVVDAIGPETFTYRELVTQIGKTIGCRRPIVSLSPAVGHAIGYVVGKLVRDVVITRDEIAGLMSGLLCTDAPAAGTTKLTSWIRQHHDSLGRHYASELARRTNRRSTDEGLSSRPS